MLSKSERLAKFITALKKAPPASNHDEALELVSRILNEIEDEFSGVPSNPATWETDGRMYPPQSDMARPSVNVPGVIRYRNRAHVTMIASNGAFAIVALPGRAVLINRPGSDGEGFDPVAVS